MKMRKRRTMRKKEGEEGEEKKEEMGKACIRPVRKLISEQ